jgi:hypothetical protein
VINWTLMTLTIIVVATFQTSVKLGRAYGELPLHHSTAVEDAFIANGLPPCPLSAYQLPRLDTLVQALPSSSTWC